MIIALISSREFERNRHNLIETGVKSGSKRDKGNSVSDVLQKSAPIGSENCSSRHF
jgi:hypothetical protein